MAAKRRTRAAPSHLMGAWAFLIGVILAIIFGFVPAAAAGAWLTWLMIIIGIIVGILILSVKHIQVFLLASLFVVLVAAFSGLVFNMAIFVPQMLGNMIAVFVPVTIFAALKSVFSLAKF